MSTINGVGTMWRGVSKPNTDGMRIGTRWFTIVYLPVIPLSRHRFSYGGSATAKGPLLGRTTSYTIHSKESLNISEILTTYVLGWVIYPLLLTVPVALLIPVLPAPGLAGIVLTVGILLWFVLCIVVIIPRISRWSAPDAPEN